MTISPRGHRRTTDPNGFFVFGPPLTSCSPHAPGRAEELLECGTACDGRATLRVSEAADAVSPSRCSFDSKSGASLWMTTARGILY